MDDTRQTDEREDDSEGSFGALRRFFFPQPFSFMSTGIRSHEWQDTYEILFSSILISLFRRSGSAEAGGWEGQRSLP